MGVRIIGKQLALRFERGGEASRTKWVHLGTGEEGIGKHLSWRLYLITCMHASECKNEI